MTGVGWRRVALVALVLVHLDWVRQIQSWIPGEWGVALSFLVPSFFLAGWLLVPLRERQRCGFRFPLSGPVLRPSDHAGHHCADELGHTSEMHRCSCGLGFTPAEALR